MNLDLPLEFSTIPKCVILIINTKPYTRKTETPERYFCEYNIVIMGFNKKTKFQAIKMK